MTQKRTIARPAAVNRRSFLKTSAVAASSAALGGLDISRTAWAAGSDVIKVGLIGCGDRGPGAAVNCMNADKGVRLVAISDIFKDRVESGVERVRKAKPDQVAIDKDHIFWGFDAYKKVIESADLVLVACASKFHPKYLKAAIDAGKHAFVEKPNAIDPPGVRFILSVAEEAKKKNLCVASGLMSRYNLGWRETVKRVHDGAIGEIVAAESNFLRAPYRVEEHTPNLNEIEFQFRNWYHFAWLSGDDVIQSLVHNVDRISWALQEKLPVRAHGLAGRASMFHKKYGNVLDHHAVVYTYANETKLYAFCSTHTGCYGDYSDTLHGTKGRCVLMQSCLFDTKGALLWQYEGPKPNMYDQEHKELIAALRAGKTINDGLHMANSAMMGILGQMACYSGKQIAWEDAFKSNFTFGGPEDPDFTTDPPVKPDEKGIYPVAIPGQTKVI